jgi:hypothetical protein
VWASLAVLCLATAGDAQNKVRINTDSLPDATVGVLYSFTLSASGGTQPYTWSASGLPSGLNIDSRTGTISGMPVSAERRHNITAKVQAVGSSDDKGLSLTINPGPPTITTASPLPAGTAGKLYAPQMLTGTGGVPPYSWSLSAGSLPSGLNLSSTGVISGTPAVSGTFNFTVQLRDDDRPAATAAKSFAITINSAIAPLSIITESLGTGTVGTEYSQVLTASGGTPPYTWSLLSGTLPSGLTVVSDGRIAGRPAAVGSQDFVLKVTDSAGATATRSFSLLVQTVGGGSFPTITTNLPATGAPTQQMNPTLYLSAPFPSAIPIQLNVSFSSNAAVPADDPMTQFSNGSRTVSLTIPPNTTSFAVPVSLFLGTVSGTVRLTGSVQSGPSDIPVGSLTIPPSSPQITNVNVSRPNGGLELQITGYSPMRRVVSVEFGFDVRTPTGTQRVTLRRNVESDFTNWYRASASSAFGSAFSYLQTFTVQPNVSVDSVVVTLINEQGGAPTTSLPITN